MLGDNPFDYVSQQYHRLWNELSILSSQDSVPQVKDPSWLPLEIYIKVKQIPLLR